jgi:hypothetical protein
MLPCDPGSGLRMSPAVSPLTDSLGFPRALRHLILSWRVRLYCRNEPDRIGLFRKFRRVHPVESSDYRPCVGNAMSLVR